MPSVQTYYCRGRKSHEPFPAYSAGYRLLRGDTAGFPRPANAPSCVVSHAVQRDSSTPHAAEGQHEVTSSLRVGFTDVFDFSCTIPSSFYPKFGMKKKMLFTIIGYYNTEIQNISTFCISVAFKSK